MRNHIEQERNSLDIPKRTFVKRIVAKFKINPENIPYFIFPIVEFIRYEKPDLIIVLDSGARLTGLTVLLLYRELYGRLPTQDGILHFDRISHGFSYEQVVNSLKEKYSQQLCGGETKTILIIDDWTNTGRTSSMVRKAISEISNNKIRTVVGVMREFFTGFADLKGDDFSIAQTTWHHNSRQIGIEYEGLIPKVVRSKEALNIRKIIIENVLLFASQVRLLNGKELDEILRTRSN